MPSSIRPTSRTVTGAPLVLAEITQRFPWLRHLFADGGDAGGKLKDALRKIGDRTVEIIKRSDRAQGFEVLPRRWVVVGAFICKHGVLHYPVISLDGRLSLPTARTAPPGFVITVSRRSHLSALKRIWLCLKDSVEPQSAKPVSRAADEQTSLIARGKLSGGRLSLWIVL